ncbi:MAG: hypothetical protein KDC38_11090, partial [Planctomycetes bacterium]|nr:hypothetical protein [Planctomycetota bacterium]
LQLLRELMDLAAQGASGGAGSSGSARSKRLAFGRRLIGLGELVPPDVYLDLGGAFLEAGEVTSAAKTFAMASEVPDYGAFQLKVASAFERARYLEESLRVYERLLVSQSSDVGLMTKVGELHEQLGRDDRATELYHRALELLLSRRPFSTVQEEKPEDDSPYAFYFARNTNDFDQYYERLLTGYLCTTTWEDAGSVGVAAQLEAQRERVAADLARLRAQLEQNDDPEFEAKIGLYPRIQARADFHRRVALVFGRPEVAKSLDLQLLGAFPKDDDLLEDLVRQRLEWGMVAAARALIDEADRSESDKREVRFLVGAFDADSVPGVLPAKEALQLFLTPLIQGERGAVRTLLQRVDFSSMAIEELEVVPVLFSASTYLDDPDASLMMARYWMRLIAKHRKSYQLQSELRQVLDRTEGLLDVDQQKSLIDYLVSLTLENEEKGGELIPLFPDLQKRSEAPLLEPDKVVEFIEKYVERSSYGVGPLFALVPVEDRVGVLRRIWPKVQPTRRANFIIDLATAFEERIGDDLRDFLVGSFGEAYDDLDHKDYFGYSIASALDAKGENQEVFLDIARQVLEVTEDDVQTRASYAIALLGRGAAEEGATREGTMAEAVAQLDRAYRDGIAGKKDDWRARQALDRLYDSFLPEYLDAFLAVLDELEKQDGESPELTGRRIDLMEKTGDRERVLAELRRAVEKHPKDVGLRDRLQSQLRSLGFRSEALALLEEIVALEPKNKIYRRRLVALWSSLGHYARALAVKTEGEAVDAQEKESEDEVESKDPIARPNIVLVKKAIEAGDFDEARLVFRRFWRAFRVDDGSSRIFFPRMRLEISWPQERAKSDEPYRGGLTTFEEEPAEELERQSAYVALADYDFGLDEIERRLRTLPPLSLEQAGPLYEGLTHGLERDPGAGAAITSLLERLSEGRASKVDYVLLLSLFEKDPTRVGAEGRSLLTDLARTIHPLAGEQLRRLARLYARMGAETEAANLYRWCGSLASWEYYFAIDDRFPPIPANELLDEVVETLSGDLRVRVIDELLRLGEPAADSYARDAFESRVLETWEKILGPVAALAKCREICDGATDLSGQVKRNSARIAARMYARAAETERALDCLEVAFCPDVRSQNPRYAYYGRGWWAPSHDDIRKLFPSSGEGFSDREAWLDSAADRLGQWVREDRVDGRRFLDALSVLAVRLHDAGHSERARALLETIRGIAGDFAADQLWVIDVARAMGEETEARSIERRLLEERRLNYARTPEVLERIAEEEGVEVALRLAESFAELTRNEAIVDEIIALAERRGDTDRVAQWRHAKEESELARTTLESPDE